MQKLTEIFRREKMVVHPDKDDDSQSGEHANDDARGACGPVGVCEGLLDKGEFGVGFRVCESGLMLVSFRR